MSNKIKLCLLKLKFDQPLKRNVRAKDLRGAISNLNRDKSLFHQHTANGGLIFKYPLVQYKIIRGEGLLVGINKGAQAVAELEILKEEFKLANEEYILLQNEVSFHSPAIGITNDHLLKYIFIIPWLALNQKNTTKWPLLHREGKVKVLERILIGNILSMAKGLEYVVTDEIKAEVNVKPLKKPVNYKGNKFIGFMGTFKVNFELPDYIGLGKGVSRGFGTVKRIN